MYVSVQIKDPLLLFCDRIRCLHFWTGVLSGAPDLVQEMTQVWDATLANAVVVSVYRTVNGLKCVIPDQALEQ